MRTATAPPLRRQLLRSALAVAAAGIVAVSGLFIAREVESTRARRLDASGRLADRAVAALARSGGSATSTDLASAAAEAGALAAVLRAEDGRELARWSRYDAVDLRDIAAGDATDGTDGLLAFVARPLRTEGGAPARLQVVFDRSTDIDGHLASAALAAAILAGAALAAALAAHRLGRRTLRPLDELRDTVAGVARTCDLSARTVAGGPAEVDALATEVNSMLAVLEQRDTGRRAEQATLAADLAAARESLRVAAESAGAAARAKSIFLANMSHEVRTPLNAILGMTELALSATDRSAQEEHLRVVREAANTLLAMVDDLLDVARLDAGHVTLEATGFDLRGAVAEAVDPFVGRARGKGLRFSIAVDPGVPDRVTGDVRRLRQILGNLVANAVKFTERGSIDVRVTPGPAEDGAACRLAFTVRDTGIGITEDMQDLLFQAFSQVDGSATRTHGGTGLGLALCNRLASLMGGTLRVESEPGRGSTFTLALDFRREIEAPGALRGEQVAAAGPPVLPAPSTTGGRRLRLLIAEDNPVNQRVAELILARLGHVTAVAANGAEAVTAWQDGAFDAILMDVAMPVMSGLDATTAIRRLEAGASHRIPIIALTANAMPGDRDLCFRSGMDGYLRKPIRTDELARVLEAISAAAEAGRPFACGVPEAV